MNGFYLEVVLLDDWLLAPGNLMTINMIEVDSMTRVTQRIDITESFGHILDSYSEMYCGQPKMPGMQDLIDGRYYRFDADESFALKDFYDLLVRVFKVRGMIVLGTDSTEFFGDLLWV